LSVKLTVVPSVRKSLPPVVADIERAGGPKIDLVRSLRARAAQSPNRQRAGDKGCTLDEPATRQPRSTT
jgi:hypothetical protein